LYYKASREKKRESLQSSAGTFSPECNATSIKNTIRLALNMYILWQHLDIALQQLTAPVPRVIRKTTMGYAIVWGCGSGKFAKLDLMNPYDH